ncbi:rhomboid family intramembrane serine protease [Actibacterium sp. D379-3]
MSNSAEGRRPAAVLVGICVLCVLPELGLQGADLGLWGSAGWRALAYQNGAFWPGLLGNWRPNYAGQPVLMFLSYGFLHGGLWHLVLNMMTLFSLGVPLVLRLGQVRFLALYLIATLGGAAGFGLLFPGAQPMVGASGALFGLAGALIGRDTADRLAAGQGARQVLGAMGWPMLGLIGLNLLMYWAMAGRLAWQTHLGGFIAGWAAAALLDRRRTGADTAA